MDTISPPACTDDQSHVFIVMATFNGGQYVRQQIESIQQQSHRNWTLLVRDDGSTDQTLDVIRSMRGVDSRIELTEDQDHLGCAANFGALLQLAHSAGATHVLVADQDDVWNPNKISITLRELRQAEAQYGSETPLLVHSDLVVVDSALNMIAPSFMSFCKLRHESNSPLRTLLVQNFVTGCTIMVNRALLDIAVPLPKKILIHDWWLAQCAAATGKILFVQESTILYRQHAGNALGVRSAKKRIWHLPVIRKQLLHVTARGVVQARQLLHRLEELQISTDGTTLVRSFCRAFARDCSNISRLAQLISIGVKRQRFFHHIAWLGQSVLLSESAFSDCE